MSFFFLHFYLLSATLLPFFLPLPPLLSSPISFFSLHFSSFLPFLFSSLSIICIFLLPDSTSSSRFPSTVCFLCFLLYSTLLTSSFWITFFLSFLCHFFLPWVIPSAFLCFLPSFLQTEGTGLKCTQCGVNIALCYPHSLNELFWPSVIVIFYITAGSLDQLNSSVGRFSAHRHWVTLTLYCVGAILTQQWLNFIPVHFSVSTSFSYFLLR